MSVSYLARLTVSEGEISGPPIVSAHGGEEVTDHSSGIGAVDTLSDPKSFDMELEAFRPRNYSDEIGPMRTIPPESKVAVRVASLVDR